MLRTIIKKEFRGNVTSLRFVLTMLLVVLAFIVSGIAFVGKYRREIQDFTAITGQNLAGLRNESRSLNLIPYYTQTIRKKPLATQLCAEGYEKSLPGTLRLDVFNIGYPEVESRSNFLFPRFADIDWTFIISIILSFIAVLMTFDSLSAEKQRGTLGLMLANAVPRDKVIIGKYLSGLLTISIPLAIGLLLNILIVTLGGVPFTAKGHLPKILAFLVLSLIFLSFFVLLGTLVSSRTSRSSSSIVVLLFIWVILALVIPGFGRIAAEKIVKAPLRVEVDRQMSDAVNQVWSNLDKFGRDAGTWGGVSRSNPPARAALFNAQTEAKNRVQDNYFSKILAQVDAGRKLTRISPVARYQYASETLAGTGIARFKNFYFQIKRYKEILREFILAKDKEDSRSLHLLAEWEGHREMLSAGPVDFNAIPRFEEKDMTTGAALKDALRDIGILVGLNILLWFCVYVSFLTADVRPK